MSSTPTTSSSSQSSFSSSDVVTDICLWRRKKFSFLLLSAATIAWMLLDVYQFNFVTVISWAAISAVSALFLYGNLVRLISKEEPNLSGLGISEQSASAVANSVRESLEEGMRWMLHASAEREWFVFARVVAVLWFLSYVGSRFDLTTLLYTGVVLGMTVPVIYVKNEDKIKRCEEWARMRSRRFYYMVDEKVFKTIKNKVAPLVGGKREKKEKKVE